MTDVLTHFKPGELIALVAVAGGMLIALTAILGGFWHQARLTALKHEMVGRGMSADEIRDVIAAGSDHRHRRHGCRV